MNPVITFDDYTKIGMMETALSNHAEEAFSELSEEKQKIAEKIFKCLTETDRENREIRRATTIDKLCAVANADFSEAAEVIEVFRKEGRTFLMPPPDVKLNENSLIDISHESLIRNWERLKKWVEEEGQSAQTYRRLAEDAFLHQKGKVGFWSEPELSDAIAWSEDFDPNETWAQLYKEKGERQYRASFAEAMQYLDDSKAARDAEIAEDERQQNALRKYARNLRWAVFGLVFVLLATVGAAAFAVYQMNEAVRIKEALVDEKKNTDDLNGKLRVEKQNTENAFNNLQSKTNELETKKEELSESLDKQKEATEKAEEQKERADKEAEQAKLSEGEKQKALEDQKRLAAEAKIAKGVAEKKRAEAEQLLARATASEGRAETNRTALTFLEQGEYEQAKRKFEALLKSYLEEPMPEEARTDGKWWAMHNLGIVYSKLNVSGTPAEREANLLTAETFYLKAIQTLKSANNGNTSQTFQPQSSGQYFIKASYDEKEDEINRCLVTTYRRLAQLYRAQAENATKEADVNSLNDKAVKAYDKLLLTLANEPQNAKQPSYPADVLVELADTHYDLYKYDEAIKNYKKAENIYQDKNDYDKQIEVLKKWSDAALSQSDDESVKLLEKAVGIQENKNKMDLSPVHLEVAESYDRLAKATELEPTVYGNRFMPPLYNDLFDLIRVVNFSVYNKTVRISDEDVSKLAAAYIKIGKCRRAEEVYKFAIKRATQSYEAAHYGGVYLLLYNDLGDFYQFILHDDQKAQEYFDKFAEGVEDETVRASDTEKFYIRAGDFYAAKGYYARAGKLYEYALKNIKNDRVDSDYNKAFDDDEKDRIIDLILAKSETITKIARLFEAQNKLPEAEAKYLEAVNLIVSKRIESHPMAARASIAQADFYEKSGDKKKARDIYNKVAANLIPTTFPGSNSSSADQTSLVFTGTFITEKMVQYIHIQKKLGDLNRENAQVAADYYKKAFAMLETYYGTARDNQDSASNKEYTRYSRSGIITNEYWTDSVEILEAWGSLPGVTGAEAAKKRAEEIRKDIETDEDDTCHEGKSN